MIVAAGAVIRPIETWRPIVMGADKVEEGGRGGGGGGGGVDVVLLGEGRK